MAGVCVHRVRVTTLGALLPLRFLLTEVGGGYFTVEDAADVDVEAEPEELRVLAELECRSYAGTLIIRSRYT